VGPGPSRPGDLLTPSRPRQGRRALWRVRGHLMSNPELEKSKFFNSIKSLVRNREMSSRLVNNSSNARTLHRNCLPELGYFSVGDSTIGTEQRVTVTNVGPCALGTETSSDRHPVR
jgi:hypothetical protein